MNKKSYVDLHRRTHYPRKGTYINSMEVNIYTVRLFVRWQRTSFYFRRKQVYKKKKHNKVYVYGGAIYG